jgi:hypothetical protein
VTYDEKKNLQQKTLPAMTTGGRMVDPTIGLWVNLLNHFKKHDLVMEGPLANLKACHMTFDQPERYPSK